MSAGIVTWLLEVMRIFESPTLTCQSRKEWLESKSPYVASLTGNLMRELGAFDAKNGQLLDWVSQG